MRPLFPTSVNRLEQEGMTVAVAVIAAGDDLTRIVDAHGLLKDQTGVIQYDGVKVNHLAVFVEKGVGDQGTADTLTARDYRLSMTAQVTARERISGKVVLDQEISGFTLLRVGPDLVSSERQILPLLAGDLAKNVTSRLADGSS